MELRFTAASTREALSPGLLLASTALAAGSAVIALLGGLALTGAVLIGVLLGGLCLVFVGYLRLSAQAREVKIAVTPEVLSVRDGNRQRTVPLTGVSRIQIVHDGAPARVAVRAGEDRFNWSIGHLHRHNTVERFVSEAPDEVDGWLRASGMRRTETVKRGVLSTDYRR
ncbi:hypothetical protein [Leucobacter komagatae]|nr:hypothetical protein [Leucobacter komagatae]